MKKQVFWYFAVLMVAALFFNSCEKEGLEDNAILKSKPADFEQPIVLPLEWQCGDMLSTDLLAGKYSKAGVVEVTSDEDNLYVKYITDGWGITETHLSVTSSLEDVPGWPGNPEIGKFNYKGEHADLDEVTYTIPLSDFPGVKSFVILAHAVVKDISGCVADWYAFNALIPSTVATANYESGADGTGGSYFSIDISNDGYLNGEDYEGWCLDLNHGIKLPATSLVKFISTYDDNFAAMVGSQIDMPENIKAVNWIINQDFVGKEYAEGVVFTRGDVQTAIWRLLETTLHTHWLADEERYTYIWEQAGNHPDYEPGCDDLVGIVLLPVDEYGAFNSMQPTLISIPMPCECEGDETAWAAGNAFTGRNWAMYFDYCIK